VIIAAGVTDSRLEIPAVDGLLGAGVVYSAAGVEALAVAGENVHVVGGANSAGQAAPHLAKSPRRPHPPGTVDLCQITSLAEFHADRADSAIRLGGRRGSILLSVI
jgi:hypothetical protein